MHIQGYHIQNGFEHFTSPSCFHGVCWLSGCYCSSTSRTSICCMECMQEWRELKRRGLNPSLGWQMYPKNQPQLAMQVPGWPPQMHR